MKHETLKRISKEHNIPFNVCEVPEITLARLVSAGIIPEKYDRVFYKTIKEEELFKEMEELKASIKDSYKKKSLEHRNDIDGKHTGLETIKACIESLSTLFQEAKYFKLALFIVEDNYAEAIICLENNELRLMTDTRKEELNWNIVTVKTKENHNEN